MAKRRVDSEGRRSRPLKRTKKSKVVRQRWGTNPRNQRLGEEDPAADCGLDPAASPSRTPRTPRLARAEPGPATPLTPLARGDDHDMDWGGSDADSLASLEVESGPAPDPDLRMGGTRIVEPQGLFNQLQVVFKHCLQCTGGDMKLQREIRSGLHSTWVFHCIMCEKTLRVKSHSDSENALNTQCVWGAICGGSGFSQAEEFLSLLGVPFMSKRKFQKEEESVGQAWKESLTKMIHENGLKEAEIGRQKGHTMTFQGKTVIWIVVRGDGGWCKRSYGHSYNAKSGVVILIGAETGLILFLMVKNVYCSTCEWAKRNKREAKDHVCYRNHTGSSTSMEMAGLVEGFRSSIDQHGLLYKKFIADGDSSTMTGIRERVPYGSLVDKIECSNHKTRNFCNKVHALSKDTKYALEERQVLTSCQPGDTIPRVDRLVTGARGAIQAAGEIQKQHGWVVCDEAYHQLEKDLKNLPYHVMGSHDNCEDRYCERKNRGEENCVVRAGAVFKAVVSLIQDKLLLYLSSLVFNEDTNDCERYMGMVAKMTGGKRVDFSKSGSYQRRCDAAALAMNKGPGWHMSPLRRLRGGRTPEQSVKRLCERRERLRSARRLSYQAARDKPGSSRFKKRRGAGPDGYYGEAQEDMPEDELEAARRTLLQEMRDAFDTGEKRVQFETETRDQFKSELYKYWHHRLITSTKFKDIVRRKPYTPCSGHVSKILYPRNLENQPQIVFGKKWEDRAVEMFSELHGKKVRRSGLWVYGEEPYCLGTSPDGIVLNGDGTDGDEVVEVKCLERPQIFHVEQLYSSAEFLQKVDDSGKKVPRPSNGKTGPRGKGKGRQVREEGESIEPHNDNEPAGRAYHWSLKLVHNYYYQIQGQLNITDKSRCYFCVYFRYGSDDERHQKEHLWVQVIERDVNYFNSDILTKFFMDCVLDERADPRHTRKMSIRDPPYIRDAIIKRQQDLQAAEKSGKKRAQATLENDTTTNV